MGISSPIGYVTPITYGAHGKAIAAFLPKTELEELLKNDKLYFYGSPDKFNKKRLLQELVECRRNGFSLETGDIQKGMNGVASPILDQNSRPVGYITVVGFFSEEEAVKLGPLAVGAAKIISQQAGHLIIWRRANRRNKLA